MIFAIPLRPVWHRGMFDLYKISKLLGHKDIRMTQRYAHHCSDSLRDGVRILEADYVLTTLETKA
jgi:integrase